MSQPPIWTRRKFLQASAAGTSLAAASAAWAQGAPPKGVTVGLVCRGAADDLGWNQAHSVAARAFRAMPGVTVIEKYHVPDTAAVGKVIDDLVKVSGASLVLGTSLGYFDPFMVDAAKRHPTVQFRHASLLWNFEKHPMNLGGYFSHLDQGHYVNGIAAGLSTRSNRIGYVAAKAIPLVLRDVNAFTLGVRKVNPTATVHLVWTGDWVVPAREAEATESLVAGGCDVIACHVDSPKVVIETAERLGAKSLGHNASQAHLAPKGFITGAEYRWEPVYRAFAATLAKGGKLPDTVFGGYDKEMVASTPFGAGASDKARNAATAVIAEMRDSRWFYIGPIKSNTGKVVLDRTYGNYDPALRTMDFLVEGVVGSLG